MASKILNALEDLFDDLGSIEAATIIEYTDSHKAAAYTKISIDGDTLCFIDSTEPARNKDTHLASIKASIKSRKILLDFIITTTKNISL